MPSKVHKANKLYSFIIILSFTISKRNSYFLCVEDYVVNPHHVSSFHLIIPTNGIRWRFMKKLRPRRQQKLWILNLEKTLI